MRFLIGVVAGVVLAVVAVFAYLHFGSVPVAVADKSFPQERAIMGAALDARIDRDTKDLQPAAQANADTFNAGAPIYVEHCAYCHGVPDKPSELARHTYPHMPQLFNRHGDVVGVSDDPPAETYWKVKNGIRLTGMPSYDGILSEQQMWQVAQLLANADKLPADVQQKLAPTGQTPAPQTPDAAAPAPAQ